MKSVLTYGISWLPVGGRERALAEPGAAEAAVRDRVERLHELVALAVLPERQAAGQRAEDLVVVQGWSQIGDALVDVAISRYGGAAAGDEEAEPDRDVRDARRRDVEHREEDPEVEERRAEVVRHDEHEHRRCPRSASSGPEVLQPALREHLALLAQVRGEEDDQRRSSPARPAGTGTSRRAPRAARR